MKKTISLIILLFIIFKSNAQRIEIGQDAWELKSMIEWSTKQHTGYDSYGNSKGNNVTSDVDYYDGEIFKINQCYRNQFLLDLRVSATFCKHYIIEKSKLVYILTQYEDISTEKLKNFYTKSDDYVKVEDYYFTDNWEHYSKIYLALNGYATVEWGKSNSDKIPVEIKKIIDKKIKNIEHQKNINLNKENEKLLFERKNTMYNYQVLNSNDYNEIEIGITKKIKEILSTEDSENIDFKIDIIFQIDTLLNKSQNIVFRDLENLNIKNKINSYLETVKLKPTYKNEYTVNSKAKYTLKFSQFSNEFYFSKNNNELSLKKGNISIFEDNKLIIFDKISSNPDGKYKIIFDKTNLNGNSFENIKYIDYKNYGNSASAVYSIVVPGLGDNFVNGNKGSMFGKNIPPLVTTIGVYGLIGSGVFLKIQSNNNYKSYHQSTNQNEINKYYDLANSQNQTALTLMGIGGIIWIADIFWVLKKGSDNKKSEKVTREKLNIAFVPYFNNTYAFNLTYNF